MASAQRTASRPVGSRSSSGQGGIFSFVMKAFFWLFFSLFFSILIEWIGLTYWWPEEGVQHSRDMYSRELEYLSGDLQQSLFFSDPAGTAAYLSGMVYELWERSGLLEVIAWMGLPPPDDAGALRLLAHRFHDYAAATVYITMVFSVRVAILALATPVFVLFGIIGLVDGLVERDLRRFSVGRESAYVFHLAKRAVAPMILLTWALYLSMPFSVHPAIVILPFAASFAFFLRLSASSFKKYL